MVNIILQSFEEFLDRNSLSYVVLSSELNSRFFDEDVDVLCDVEDIDILIRDFLRKEGYEVVSIWHHSRYGSNYFLRCDGICVNLDIYNQLAVDERVVIPRRDFFDAELFMRTKHLRIFRLLKNAHKGIGLDSIISVEKVIGFDMAFEFKDKILIKDLYNQFIASSPRKKSLHNLRRLIKRLFEPNGIVVAILGPDGSGKSSVINAISNKNVPFRKKVVYHLYPAKSRLVSDDIASVVEKGQEPYTMAPYNPFVSLLKIVLLITRTWYYWLVNIVKLKRSSSLIILDRYMYEIAIDPARFRLPKSRYYSKIIGLFPSPDIVIYFKGTPEVFFERKGESSVETIRLNLERYKQVGSAKDWSSINADNELWRVIHLVENKLTSYSASRLL
ncbi:hypothetical protein N9P12_02230 [Bacteroidia bacterium]|nr:hypothetical protein [Bacteroidia bacterium]